MIEAFVEIRTPRLRLRPFVGTDIDERYVAWLRDPAVVRFSNQRFRHHDRDTCARYLAGFAGADDVFVSLHTLDDDRAIGTMTAYRNRHHRTADIGILVGEREAWGRGYGQEAWNAMLNWLCALPGMRKLSCGTLACNESMLKLARRSGMQLEATRRAQELVDGVAVDMHHFARFTDAA